MERRRNGTGRYTVEEVECWNHVATSLKQLSTLYTKSATTETISRVNRLISAWPTDDSLPAEGVASLKPIQSRITQTLTNIKETAEEEAKIIEEALDRVAILMALRETPSTDKVQRKRAAVPSPVGTPAGSTSSAGNGRITVPPRTSSVGPPATQRDSRSKKDGLVKPQQTLHVGRKVVFRPPKSTDTEEGTWIVAIITKVLPNGKYEVQDAEPQDDGQPGTVYTASLKAIVPLPEPDAPSGSPAHLSLYPVFPVGSVVLALYPDTSCFYRAEVISAPQTPDRAPPSSKFTPIYQVRFEDDDDMIHQVSAYRVVKYPAHLL
ncbi:hypothetical protein CPC08DRAFT_658617 [Agrocybe pediades]|nr:hypothetical protein CPC08DRAFT_658617 [Agrocybe pediades]